MAQKRLSTHGKLLLMELNSPENARIEVCIDYVKRDPNAGLLKDDASGNNSFHLLLGSNYREDFVQALFNELIVSCPMGVKAVNKSGSTPLHLCLCQPVILVPIATKILEICPKTASIPNGQGLVPIFLSVMRNNPSPELTKKLCQAFPAGPSTFNKTHSLPLHFAAYRERPNKEILQMLIRRYPQGAAMKNDYGMLPLHCICSFCSEDVESIKLLYEAYPEGIRIPDRQGKTCLHLATLAVGKNHTQAVLREEEELTLEQVAREGTTSSGGDDSHQERSRPTGDDAYHDDEYYDDDDGEEDLGHSQSSRKSRRSELDELDNTKSRQVIRFLVHLYPQALVTENNFQAIPVETVLEKTRAMKTKYKKVSVYGLYDDPPTARLLLYAHWSYSQKKILPPPRFKYTQILRELNWLARREALLLALDGDWPRPRPQQPVVSNSSSSSNNNLSSKLSGSTKNHKQHSGRGDKRGGSSAGAEARPLVPAPLSKNNILGRLIREGYEDCARYCILWL